MDLKVAGIEFLVYVSPPLRPQELGWFLQLHKATELSHLWRSEFPTVGLRGARVSSAAPSLCVVDPRSHPEISLCA